MKRDSGVRLWGWRRGACLWVLTVSLGYATAGMLKLALNHAIHGAVKIAVRGVVRVIFRGVVREYIGV